MRVDKAPTISSISNAQQLQREIAKSFNALLVRKNRSANPITGPSNPAAAWAAFIAGLTAIGADLADAAGRPASAEAKVATTPAEPAKAPAKAPTKAS